MYRVLAFAALLFAAQSLASPSFSNTDPLLAIDLYRSAIIADIVRSFEVKADSPESAKLRERLEKLRADRLLAASLASSRTSLDAILAEADSPRPTAFASTREKALGDANRDLVYTPIVPCPIVNTYNSPIGRLPAASITAFDAIAADFTLQGGQNSCATQLPANTAAIAAQIAVVSPSNEGWLNLWPVGQTIPNNVTLGYYRNQAGDMPNIVTNSALVPLCTSACAGGKEFNLYTASEAVVTISVVGYFAPPLGGVPSGTVIGVTASTPLASSGGTVPNISLVGGVAGQVLAGTAGAPAWTASPSLTGNLLLSDSSATAGNIIKGAERFVHNFGTNSSFIGKGAGNFTMTGPNNTGVGATTLPSVTTGSNNTAIGVGALDHNTTGSWNAAMGASALSANEIGSYNTAVGYQALLSSTGNWNTAVGYYAGYLNVTGGDNIYINNYGVATDTNTARIGGGYISRTFIAGIRGVTTGIANAIPVLIDSAGQLGTASSSRRFKDDIADMGVASNGLMRLRPVTFHYKSDKHPSGRTLQYGLIAEEVAEVYPGLVAHSADGQVETVMYQFLPSMLLNEFQKQQRTIVAQAKHIEEMQRTYTAEIAGLKKAVAKVTELEEKMAHMARLLDQPRTGTVTAGLLK